MIDDEENFRWDFVRNDYLVRWMVGNKVDWYFISEPSQTKNNSINASVTCPHISTMLKTKNIYLEFDDENGIGTLQYLAEQILAGTGWTIGRSPRFLERDGVTEKVRSLKDSSKAGAYQLITKMCNLFNAYPDYQGDTRTVDFYSLNDRTVEWEFIVGKNLNSITVKNDSDSIVTRLYVEGEYSDFGYVGIDDVNPTGLSYLLNFDYYKELGLFTQAHQDALDTYTAAAVTKKGEISAAQAALNEATTKVVYAVGYTPFTIYTLTESGDGYKVVDQQYPINGATRTPAENDNIYALRVETITDEATQETTEKNVYDIIPVPATGKYPEEYEYLVYFERPALGQVGVNEASIEAKEKSIEGWQKKMDKTADVQKKNDYNNNINTLRAEIQMVYDGIGDNPGLYAQIWTLATVDGPAMYNSQNSVTTLVSELEELEAVFTAAMGDLLKDGRWSDENYAVGQEESLYLDALDMSERCSKPKVTYSMSYTSAKEYLGVGAEDIEINAVGHILDEHLHINDYGYIKSITIVHDNEKDSKVDITTDDGFSKQVSLESVLTRIAQMAELVKAKNALFDRAGVIEANGKIAADRLEGMIDLMQNKLSSTTSNWYTDDNGNIVFESVNGNGAMMLCGEGFMLAADRNPDGSWNWRTLGGGNGIVADEITTGFLSAERIQAGSVTADKIENGFGATIDLSQNQIMTTIKNAEDEAVRTAQTNYQQTIDEFRMSITTQYAAKDATESALTELHNQAVEVTKYLSFGEDYLVIGTTDNKFNVQITNNAINFRNGEQVLAYMTNQKLYISESEVTHSQRIGNYLWMLPNQNGSVALIYTGT